jgi:hypothetical protein
MSAVEIKIEMPEFTVLKQIQQQKDSIYRNAGEYLARCIRNHMRMLAQTRHSSSSKLGAKPSNHFKASDVLEPVVKEDSVNVGITTPGISRAYHDIDIYPKEARALTIPLHADAYGMTARELTDRGTKLFRIKKNGMPGNVLYKNEDGKIIPMYALTSHVHQVKDPTLMPTDNDMLEQATNGALETINHILGI